MIHIKRLNEMFNAPASQTELDSILAEMNALLKDYDLEGVELTPEDAQTVINRIKNDRMSREDAISDVLNGIRETLD